MTAIPREIRRVLIANRGEIAVRIIRACREEGITSVAVYSDPDRTSNHVLLADEAYRLGGAAPRESYLNQGRILEICREAKVDAVHPGYGFLAENPEFTERLEHEEICFIGPGSAAIRALGDKMRARQLSRELGIPTVVGSSSAIESEADARQVAEEIGYPVLLKAAAGGGGKGMRIVAAAKDFASALRAAKSEALGAFGDSRVYLEKYISAPRHVEMQILGDGNGNAVYLGERDCSVQRRHQKVIEESPCPIMTPELRQRMGEAAVRLVSAAKYANAGTVEFLVDAKGEFFFLEVNTRLQVEHPVTESITAMDLVKEQFRIARTSALAIRQEEVSIRGAALECRIYAEDPSEGFMPSTGKLKTYWVPSGPRVRIDSGYREGDSVEIYYDPLLAKVITWGRSREEAIGTMLRALAEFRIVGVRTTIPFCAAVLEHESFRSGSYNTGFVAEYFDPKLLGAPRDGELAAAALTAAHVTLRKSPKPARHYGAGRTSAWKYRGREPE